LCCPALLRACGNHSGEAEHHSGIGLKLFGFIPEPVFTFIPESCSRSSRNTIRNHPGITFILPRIPQHDCRLANPARFDWSGLSVIAEQVHWVFWNIPATASGLPEGVPKGSQLPDGSYQISATGPMYRGPGAPASGPLHHYVFELFALDTKLDVKPTTDAFETRANVIKAIQGHILGKAVYGGLFRRPQ